MSSEYENELDIEAIDVEVEAVYAQLKSEYARTLPEKLAELEATIHSARARPDSQELFTHALNEAHRMKGTLGSYGFPELAELVASVEKLLRQNDNHPDRKGLVPSFWERIEPEVSAIFAQADQTAKRLSDSASSAK